MPTLHAELDVPLPRSIAIGSGSAVFICGWCFDREQRLRSLELVVNGELQPLMAWGMPRLDPFASLHPGADPFQLARASVDRASVEDPHLNAYASGFWGIARVAPEIARAAPGIARVAPGISRTEVVIGLSGERADGRHVDVELGRIPAAEQPVAPKPRRGVTAEHDEDRERLASSRGEVRAVEPRVAICMATYDPPDDLLHAQLESIRRQTHRNWVCFISDDCSPAQAYDRVQREVAGDRRFVVSRSPERRGFYGNFERALVMAAADPDTAYVALSDQDDRWYPEKLATLLAELGDARLVYSDARIVGTDGSVIAHSYWGERDNNHTDLLSLLVANSVTGAASLFPRSLLDDALPFPPAQFAHYHDHWLALVALSLGEIRYIPRALYDYVQHDQASLGHATATRTRTLGDRWRGLAQRGPRERVRKWRMHYFVDVVRLLTFATVIDMRCRERMPAGRRRVLDTFLACDRSLVELSVLFGRGVRELGGRNETLGAEWMLFLALLWRRLLSASASERPRQRLRLDALAPGDLAPRPERAAETSVAAVRAVAEKIAPLSLAPSESAPARINLLIPTIDLRHLFAGYIGKFNFARALAERGERVRVITVDPVGALPRDWRRTLGSYRGLERLHELVEFTFGRESAIVEVSPSDRFIATTWWTAHIAARAVADLGGERFLYLVQEYEPFTFPMGTYAALAAQSYEFDHVALFSSELLRAYFRERRLGVFSRSEAEGDERSRSFQNALTRIDPPAAAELRARRGARRLLFYARPEAHAARNMFELGMLALGAVARDDGFSDGWELHGIGSVADATTLPIGGRMTLQLLPRLGEAAYTRLLREHDVGLALMYTPHPSLVPLEMASAGLLTITNSCENKTADELARISSNLIVARPNLAAVVEAIHEALAGVEDHERRIRGAEVAWSRDWETSFDGELLDWVLAAPWPR